MEIEEDKMSHCETCTCGLTYIYWSDRESHVDLTSPGKVAEAVMSCALDHSYDRTGTGIPYGFPDGLADALTPIVAKHLSAVEPDWEHKSVYMDDHNWSEKGTPQRDAFKKELIEAVEAYYTK